MGDGLCPECGCILEEHVHEIYLGRSEEDSVTEITLECPCCDYVETVYDA